MGLHESLSTLADWKQFILCVREPAQDGKTAKYPLHPHTLRRHDAHDPSAWMDAPTAYALAGALGEPYGVGFVFTQDDPFFFVDIDNCLDLSTNSWTGFAVELCRRLPGAAIEVSQSGRGLHIIGSGAVPEPRRIKDRENRFDLYSRGRFVLLTGTGAVGDAGIDQSAGLAAIVTEWLQPDAGAAPAEWTDSPAPDWCGPTDDDELIRRMLTSRPSAGAAFGARATPAQLWTADADALGRAYPDPARPWDASAADAALAAHLAFWTGRDCGRIERIMRRSALARDKWEREDYMRATIVGACARVTEVCKDARRPVTAADQTAAAAAPATAAAVRALPFGFVDARDGAADAPPLSELGNAQRLHRSHGGRLRYAIEPGAWLCWENGWVWDRDGARVRSMMAGLPAALYAEAASDLSQAPHYVKWARESQKARTIRASAGILADFDGLRVSVASIDADPYLCGVDGARRVLDLTTGSVRDAAPGDYVTKSLGVSELGDPSACTRWRRFLTEVFRGDAELIAWVQRWCGYLLSGDTSEHVFFFAYGSGRNGKGTMMETLYSILGDYARPLPAAALHSGPGNSGQASPEVADLMGARMALSDETDEGPRLAEDRVKSWTGGDTITARALYSAPVSFRPQFKLMIQGNHKPVIRGTDVGMWSRVRLVPFLRYFAEHERDRGLPAALRAEAPHILAWMVEGFAAWRSSGLGDTPASIRDATAEYRGEMDLLGQWAAECTRQAGPEASVQHSTAYQSYKTWAIECGYRPMTSISFGRKMVERGAVRVVNGYKRTVYLGMELGAPAGH